MRGPASLERRLGGPMPSEVLLPLAIRLADELAELHGRGAVHGDLRPASIFVDEAAGELALASPGNAARGAGTLSEGALPYISPEQTGQMNWPIDSRSDLYSAGVVLYQLAAGRLPFEAEDAVGWVHCHLARQPRPLDRIRPPLPRPLPRPLIDIIGKLLAKLPDHRYQSALGLRHDLERCLRELRAGGGQAAFALGERDVSEELRIPQQLYGRDAEAAVLREAFERAAESGTPELVLVAGQPGIGKSAVVRELLRPVARRRGRFIAGKFEQYQRDIPYFTIVQALRALALDILAESEAGIARWRQRLLEALGPYGRLIVDLIPQLGLIVGPQPPVAELSLMDAEARLRRVFGRLFAACAAAPHPLALFIDDMQWADTASLSLVVNLLTDGEPRHLLIVGSYRDTEVDAAHPLVRALAPVRHGGARVRDIVLGPLPDAELCRLVADTVHAPVAEAAPLAELVRARTGGNPFFAIQLLTALYHKRAIWFDRQAQRWRWDKGRIRAEGVADNIAELMRGRLDTLPAETRAVLGVAACLGGAVDDATLAVACERRVTAALKPAIEQHLLLEAIQAGRRTYRFPHDRVHEAAYELVPESERARVHLEIGRRLLASTAREELVERVFEIVNQLARGAALIEAPEERTRLAELHLMAGARAQASTAYASALRYYAAGAALLAPGVPPDREALEFALELHRAECELLTGAQDAAEPRLAALTGRAASIPDAAAVAQARISLYTLRDRYDLIVAAVLDFLRRAGIEWPAHPTAGEVRREYDRIWQQLGSRAIEDLVDLPPMTDLDLVAVVDVLVIAQAQVLFFDEQLHSLLICRVVNLSLQHGNSDGSCIGYCWLGTILRPRFGNNMAGFRFGQLGLALVEQRGLARWKARVYLDFAVLIVPWTKHLRGGVELVRRAFEAAQEAGDLTFATYACSSLTSFLVATGDPLAVVQRECEASLAFARKSRIGIVIDSSLAKLQLVRSLRGLTKSVGSFDDEELAEDRHEQRLESDPSAITVCWYWIRKLQARLLAGRYTEALAAGAKAGALLWATSVFLEAAEYVFWHALACAGHHDSAPDDERAGLREAVAAHHAQLAGWAEHCPENFSGRAMLVDAELARLRGEPERASERYGEAIRAARRYGFLQDEALAYETAARFYRGRDRELIADAYVREAHARYVRWGADGKARQLQELHRELALELPAAGPAASPALRPEQLDRMSVIKASQTISSVMDKDLLSRTLLGFVLEVGGARRVALIMPRGGEGDELEIAAEAKVEGAAAPAEDARVPRSVLAYARRTGEPVLLDAAADAGRFAGDPYFAGTRPRSVLCLPVRLRAESVALLYLENELVPGAFTAERLAALELLAAQAAISLENARLLERERAGRIEAEAAERRELLLGEATALLSQTLEHGGVSGVLSQLCARGFVDWAVVDLEQEGALVRIGAAHRDPDKEPILRELVARYSPRAGAAAVPRWQVVRAGAALEVPALTADRIRADCVDDHHAELVCQLGARSAVAVPLHAGDAVIGVLMLCSAAPSRFGRADVELAVELGRRMALAIHNARLLEATRRALHLREEFLRIASHELRTPLASLRLTTQGLLRAAERKRAVSAEVMDQSLRRMLGNTTRLEQLTGELLDVTRIEAGRLPLHPAEVALDALVREAVEQLEPALAAAGSTVSIECAAPVVGRWDPSRLGQVVGNLLTNAIKFGEGRPIEIRIERTGASARLAVSDHGIGIDPARRAYVFERFERAVPSSNYGGLGLGLYIARSIVLAHGGTITVDSELGAGSTFTVTLPCEAPPREEASA